MDLELRHCINDYRFFVGWHNLEFLVVPPAKRWILYAPVLVLWREMENLQLMSVPSLPYLARYCGVLSRDDNRDTQRV